MYTEIHGNIVRMLAIMFIMYTVVAYKFKILKLHEIYDKEEMYLFCGILSTW